MIIAPDAGGVERSRWFSNKLGTGLAIIDKRRPARREVMRVIGDMEGRFFLVET